MITKLTNVLIWLSSPESGGRRLLPTKTFGPTVKIKDVTWSVVIIFDNDPIFDTWNKATVRGIVPEFPEISGVVSIYEGQHVTGWMKMYDK